MLPRQEDQPAPTTSATADPTSAPLTSSSPREGSPRRGGGVSGGDGAGLREFGPSARRIDIALSEMSPPVSLPPVSVPVLTPTQIVDRL